MSKIRMLSLAGIYLVIFIDSLGASLIIPMLTPIVHDPVAGLIRSGSETFRNTIYGTALGVFSFAMLFGAPFLGTLSDSLGRKKTLILCLSGLSLSYLFMTLAFTFNSIELFIIGRLVGGFFSGSLPVAQASIIDITDEKDRVRFIGYIMFFVSLGYVVGPLISGYLSDPTLVLWFNLMTPFIFVALLSLFNLMILLVVFQDKGVGPYNKVRMILPNPVSSLLLAVKTKETHAYSLQLLLMLMGWNTFFQFIGPFLTDNLDFSQHEVSNFVSWIGGGLAAAFLSLVGVMMKLLKPGSVVSLALIIMAICIGSSLIATNHFVLYLLAFLGSIGFGLSYSGLMVQLSMCVDASRQGTIMGMAAAIAAFSAGFSALVFGFMSNISASAPIISALIFIFTAVFVSLKERKRELRLCK